MKVNKYPDGTSYVNSVELGQQVFRINSYEDLWHLNQFVDAFHSAYSKPHTRVRPNIFIPNLIDAQADRRFNRGESSGLKLVCEFLNGLEANFKIFHPHNAEVVEALMDNVEIEDNTSFIIKVIQSINSEHPYLPISKNMKGIPENLILMSSDAGGFKPLMKLCGNIKWTGDTYSAAKARLTDGTMLQNVGKKDFGGKDVLIVDDICVYGGTFKGLSKLLRERNVGKLYLAVSHMTIQNLGNDPVTNYFDKVFTTNSKFDSYYTIKSKVNVTQLPQPKNLEIIKMF